MKLIILGAGGFGRVVEDIASNLKKYNEIKFLDDNNNSKDVIGKLEDYKKYANAKVEFFVAFGNNKARINWINQLKEFDCKIATIISDDAYVSKKATVGIGTIILPKCAVNTNTTIGEGCILNIGSLVDHEVKIENGVHICLGAIVKANNVVPKLFKLEAGQIIERNTMG